MARAAVLSGTRGFGTVRVTVAEPYLEEDSYDDEYAGETCNSHRQDDVLFDANL